MTEEYEFYNTDPYEPDYEAATEFLRQEAIDQYDCLNGTGKYEPTPHELADQMRGNVRATDAKLLEKCKGWISQSRKLHEARKRALGLL